MGRMRFSRALRRGMPVAALLAAAGLAAPVAPALARAGAVRVGSPPALPPGTRPLAALASDRPLRITVVLRPRDPQRLRRAADAAANPASPDDRHYLTPAAFARRFAPRRGAVAAVERALRDEGLRPGRVSANGLSIPVRADVAAVERAFDTPLAAVRLPTGAGAIVNLRAPALAASVAGRVQAVVGLDTLAAPHPQRTGALLPLARPARAGRAVTGGPQPCAAATAAASAQHAYTADQIAAAYEFGGLYRRGDLGRGATVAVYELEPDDPTDIAAYQSCYGTHASVSYVPVDGGAGTGAGSGEAALDIEQLIGLAPAAHLIVYQGPNSNSNAPGAGPYDTESAIVSQDRAAVVSISWGNCEALEGRTDAAAENTLFEEAALQGQTIIAASGDEGSEDCNAPPPSIPNTALAVDDPAAQPFVLGVGGTSLMSASPPVSQTAWNNGGDLGALLGIQPGASGGGVSSLWSMPVFQAAAARGLHVIGPDASAVPCGTRHGVCREVPDVAADADPNTGYLIYYNGRAGDPAYPVGWQSTGGTSAAAPLWAALAALADAERGCHAMALGFVNPALYRLAGADMPAYFSDVTAGNNDFTGTAGGRYAARPGYDMATGLGSPRASALAAALCGGSLRLARPGPAFTFLGAAVARRLRAHDAPGAGLRFVGHGLPRGVRLGRISGRFTGRVRRLGVSRATVEARDAAGAIRAVSFRWTVDAPPSLGATPLTGVARGRPGLALSLAAGRFAPGAPTVSLRLPVGLALRTSRRITVSIGRRRVPARLSGRGRSLTVRLTSAPRRLQIRFTAGSLAAAPGLARAVADGRPPHLSVEVTLRNLRGQTSRRAVRVL